MAINKNHEFEELDGVKCSVLERNITAERVAFLKNILEYNKYTVVVIPAPPPKAAATAATEAVTTDNALPSLFILGVTDYTFNAINAIYGRLLNAPNGSKITMAYWQQKEAECNDTIPYYNK